MTMSKVSPHLRNGHKVGAYVRHSRPKAKKRIVESKAVKLYPIHNEYGERLGWSTKPPRKKK